MASQSDQETLPYYNEIHQYFLNLSNFLNITSSNDNNEFNKDRSKSTRAQKARSKLLKLSPLQFYELCTDVSDELNRRIRETGGEFKQQNNNDNKDQDYLLPKSNYHMKRNQARQKLSNLSQLRFNDLIDDILFEIKRRDYHIISANATPEPIADLPITDLPEPIADLPIAEPKIVNENIEPKVVTDTEPNLKSDNTTSDNVNTLDTNVSIPLPSMIQSSLIIPQKASIDWSDEDESIDNKHLSTTNNIESEDDNDITEDFIKSNEINNPFNNTTTSTNQGSNNNIINIPNIIEGPPELSNTPINRTDTNSPSIKQTPNEDLTAQDTTTEDEPSFFNNNTTREDIQPSEIESNNENDEGFNNSPIEVVELKKQIPPTIDLPKTNNTIPPQPSLPPPSPASHLQNELMSLNKQLTALSIENENLKTKISKLEILNNKKSNNNIITVNNDNITQNTSTKSNYIVNKLKQENIIKYITEDGIIPESLIIQLYDLITKFYQQIDGNKKNNNTLTDSSNFGEILFKLLDDFYKIVLTLIELLEKANEKDMIIGLKSIFSHFVTTTKYFASYHHILPDIVIISTINECVFVITDIINMLKVKQDDSIANASSSKDENSVINIFDRSTGVPMTPLPKINTSTNSSGINNLENSPVKPLKIIEKVASSPLINGTYEPKPMPNPLRKSSGNVLLSLNNMVKKNSNEKLNSRSNSDDSVSSSNQSSTQAKKTNNSSLVKKMSFSSSSDENNSESESDDDDTNELLLRLKQQQQQGKEVKPEPSPSKKDTQTTDNDSTISGNNVPDSNVVPQTISNNNVSYSNVVPQPISSNNASHSDVVPQTISSNNVPDSNVVPQTISNNNASHSDVVPQTISSNDVSHSNVVPQTISSTNVPDSNVVPQTISNNNVSYSNVVPQPISSNNASHSDVVPQTISSNNVSHSDVVPHIIEIDVNKAPKPTVTKIDNVPTPPVQPDFKTRSPGLNIGGSSPSGRSPSFKPIKITKLESSSLKKVDLSSKDKQNKDITGLGITLNKDVSGNSNASKKEEPVKIGTNPEMKVNEPVSKLNTSNITPQSKMMSEIPERNQRRDLDNSKINKLSKEPISIESRSDNELNFEPKNEMRQHSVTKHSLEQDLVEKEITSEPDLNETHEKKDEDFNSTPVHNDIGDNRLISGNRSISSDNHSSNNVEVNQHDDLNASPKSLDHNDNTLDEDSFQFIPLKSTTDDITKKIPEPIVEEKPEPVGKVESKDIKLESQNDNESEEEESESGSEEASETDSGGETGSEESEFESEEEEEDDDDDFDVDAFDIENPENTLSELLLYLEHQTVQVITTIQSLLTSIKDPKPTKGNLRGESNAINQVITQMVGATSISMDQSRNANLKEHGSWVVQSLEDCSRRMLILCELQKDGEFATLDNDNDFADKNFKQRLAGIAFDIAKCTKELVKTVEEASLKEEIEYLDSKIHK